MIQDFQDWAVEYEDEPGRQRVVSKELIDFYVTSYIEEMERMKEFTGQDIMTFQLNWE